MKTLLPLLTIAITFASCSSIYKSGQTPDDVYYSPARPQDEYVRVNRDRDDNRYNEDLSGDQYLRMKVRNRSRWSSMDYNDYYSYRYNPYCQCDYAGYYSSWNYFYNPYYYAPYAAYTYYPKTVVYNKPRVYNLDYVPQTNTNPKTGRPYSSSPSYVSPRSSNDNYQNSGSNAGDFLRNTFKGSSSSSSSSNNSSSGSSSGSSNSSSSSSTAPVRRF